MPLPKLLTIDEVAAAARAPRSTVFHWIYTDQLRSRRIGRRRLVAEPDLLRFLDGEKTAGSRGQR
jgi:excisionase family DNA binding protein